MKEIGIDIGNFLDKSSEEKQYEARTRKISGFSGGNSIQVEVNGEVTYQLGSGKFDSEIIKSRKEDLIPRIAALLALSSDDSDVKIGIGLPINQHQAFKKEMFNKIKENKTMNVRLKKDGAIINRTFNIVGVKIVPEALGTYFSLPLNLLREINDNELTTLIIDIGGKTIDTCLIDASGTIIDHDTFLTGILTLYNNIRNAIDSRYPDLGIELEDIDKIVKENTYISPDGEAIDLSYMADIIDTYVKEAFTTIKRRYIGFRKYKLVFCGGSCILLEKNIKNEYQNAYIHPDVYANAKGYRTLVKKSCKLLE